MKLPLFAKRSSVVLIALLAILSVGCVTTCPPKYAFHYKDAARHFSLCLPAGVKKAESGGSTVITHFPVSQVTNLEEKTLIVTTGNYDLLHGAKPLGSLAANGVVLKRVRAEEGGAGHMTLHIIYTWKKAGKAVHLDFTHRAVNVKNFDPSERPKEYDQAAQIKLSEEIMSTFRAM